MVELLVVIAIIGVIAGILIPTLGGAKKASLRTTSINNLHQCYVALALYLDESGNWRDLPDRTMAMKLLGTKITYDPADYWRASAEQASPFEAMVGSYGYANSKVCGGSEGPVSCFPLLKRPPAPMLVSVFYDDFKFEPGPYILGSEIPDFVPHPKKVLTLWADGHTKLETVPEPPGPTVGFTWSELFIDIDRIQQRSE